MTRKCILLRLQINDKTLSHGHYTTWYVVCFHFPIRAKSKCVFVAINVDDSDLCKTNQKKQLPWIIRNKHEPQKTTSTLTTKNNDQLLETTINQCHKPQQTTRKELWKIEMKNYIPVAKAHISISSNNRTYIKGK